MFCQHIKNEKNLVLGNCGFVKLLFTFPFSNGSITKEILSKYLVRRQKFHFHACKENA